MKTTVLTIQKALVTRTKKVKQSQVESKKSSAASKKSSRASGENQYEELPSNDTGNEEKKLEKGGLHQSDSNRGSSSSMTHPSLEDSDDVDARWEKISQKLLNEEPCDIQVKKQSVQLDGNHTKTPMTNRHEAPLRFLSQKCLILLEL
jgi:hypothetical protein